MLDLLEVNQHGRQICSICWLRLLALPPVVDGLFLDVDAEADAATTVDADLVRGRRHVLLRDPAPRTVDGERGHTEGWWPQRKNDIGLGFWIG